MTSLAFPQQKSLKQKDIVPFTYFNHFFTVRPLFERLGTKVRDRFGQMKDRWNTLYLAF